VRDAGWLVRIWVLVELCVCALGGPHPGDPVALVLGGDLPKALEVATSPCSLAPPRANPRHLWVESWVKIICDSPHLNVCWLENRRVHREWGGGRMMQVSAWCDTQAACGRRWFRILKCCLLRSPQYPPSAGQVTPQTPPGSDSGTGKGLLPVFTPCWKMLLFEKLC